jgi:hypothetical protein
LGAVVAVAHDHGGAAQNVRVERKRQLRARDQKGRAGAVYDGQIQVLEKKGTVLKSAQLYS